MTLRLRNTDRWVTMSPEMRKPRLQRSRGLRVKGVPAEKEGRGPCSFVAAREQRRMGKEAEVERVVPP